MDAYDILAGLGYIWERIKLRWVKKNANRINQVLTRITSGKQ